MKKSRRSISVSVLLIVLLFSIFIIAEGDFELQILDNYITSDGYLCSDYQAEIPLEIFRPPLMEFVQVPFMRISEEIVVFLRC